MASPIWTDTRRACRFYEVYSLVHYLGWAEWFWGSGCVVHAGWCGMASVTVRPKQSWLGATPVVAWDVTRFLEERVDGAFDVLRFGYCNPDHLG
ncbi:hypothetical protein NDU88_001240 [Pleurodeles waltl]|uniref:Uncharacterized protein n=1 Tax=Pleurodeles waltl TaxID=8319 RepID=A0AAV7VYE3_PLEWA|nr:hypothetical protein NDU88_001240 [Pleurodeles waltl]